MNNTVKSIIFILACAFISIISASAASAASLTAAPTSGAAPLTVTLTPTLSSTVQSYNIDFGDGTQTDLIYRDNSAFGNPISHTYTGQGNYEARLQPDNEQPHTVLISVSAPSHEIVGTKTASTHTTSIPEFPSVAVPIAAILGLIVIVGRKKT